MSGETATQVQQRIQNFDPFEKIEHDLMCWYRGLESDELREKFEHRMYGMGLRFQYAKQWRQYGASIDEAIRLSGLAQPNNS